MGRRSDSLRLRLIEAQTETILTRLEKIMATMADVQTEVNNLKAAIDPLTSAVAGSVALMDKLTAMLADALKDPTTLVQSITAIQAVVNKDKQDLADALVRNTPAGP